MSPTKKKKGQAGARKSAARKSAPRKRARAKGKAAPKKPPKSRSAKKVVAAPKRPAKPVVTKRRTKVVGEPPPVRQRGPAVAERHEEVDPEASARAVAKAERRGRAMQRQAHVAERMGSTDVGALYEAMQAAIARAAAPDGADVGIRSGMSRGRATDNTNRWVPIGPSVVRRGQADGRPRVTGRVRDLAVDPTGQRAYAASGKAGVWYTEDAGMSWSPVGGWDTVIRGRRGGASTDLSCGCLLVRFGADATDDYVMVGTGETSDEDVRRVADPLKLEFSGRGVLTGRGPTRRPERELPFDRQSGNEVFESAAVTALARDPAIADANAGAVGDRVVAACDTGLFLGVRRAAGTTVQWQWTRIASIEGLVVPGPPGPGGSAPQRFPITDMRWVRVNGVANGRIVVAIAQRGVAWSDDFLAGGSWQWIRQMNLPTDGIRISGAHKLSAVVEGRMYVLHGRLRTRAINNRNDDAALNRIPDIARTAAAGGPGAAQRVPGVPDDLWGAQRWWNQAIFAERVGATDRVWVGGSGLTPYRSADFSAALYCFDVAETGAGAPRLGPAIGVSRTTAPPGGEGANRPGLVGNGIHADVHAIRVVTRADGVRHVWVGCDGGVYVSDRGGRVNTFQSRVTGLSVVEAGFVAVHPTSSQYCALGAQDNGVQVRTGETVWELVQDGDGGGVMFHPVASQYLVSQFLRGVWQSAPRAGFVAPLDRSIGGTGNLDADRESKAACFYSGCDATASVSSGRGRIALGTNRVWISDDLGTAPHASCTWRVIRYDETQARAAVDPRPRGSDLRPRLGVPDPALGAVVQLRWASPTRLYVVYRRGIIRHDEAPPGTWSTTKILGPTQADAPDTTVVSITDLAPVPNSDSFYFTTLGDSPAAPQIPTDTCWLFEAGRFRRTNLRRQLPAEPPATIGPNDPAHAVCLDPDDTAVVYVGTMAGVWEGFRNADGTHTWAPFMNGMPVTSVSDLKIWRLPGTAPVGVKLLRAATQSRGVWEVNLAGAEPRRTYLRVHAHDDRRRLPAPLVDPRLPPASPIVAYASPDIVVRPSPRAANRPALAFPLAAGASLGPRDSGSYHLWTFQTAFRWHFPAVRADGLWSDQLADLVRLYRSLDPTLGAGDTITRDVWNAVVGGTRLDAARAVSAAPGDRWAVYETPWQTARAAPVLATEVDVLELVRPLNEAAGIWRVYAEPSMVDVLLHHRDTSPLAAGAAYTALFWKEAPSDTALLLEPAANFAPLYGWGGGATVPTPASWTPVPAPAGAVHRLSMPLDAFMPRAISIGIDLSSVAPGHHVILVAVCGGSSPGVEPPPPPSGMPPGAPTIVDLVRSWPRAAMRLVQVVGPRPV